MSGCRARLQRRSPRAAPRFPTQLTGSLRSESLSQNFGVERREADSTGRSLWTGGPSGCGNAGRPASGQFADKRQRGGSGRSVPGSLLRLSTGLAKSARRWCRSRAPLGWLQYLSKHASRGRGSLPTAGHAAGLDEARVSLWGKSSGDSWPTVEPVEAVITDATMRRMRRLVRSYVVARCSGALRSGRGRARWKQGVLGRGCPGLVGCCGAPDRGLSAVRGMSEWVPGSVLLQFAVLAGWSGELKASGRPVKVDALIYGADVPARVHELRVRRAALVRRSGVRHHG